MVENEPRQNGLRKWSICSCTVACIGQIALKGTPVFTLVINPIKFEYSFIYEDILDLPFHFISKCKLD